MCFFIVRFIVRGSCVSLCAQRETVVRSLCAFIVRSDVHDVNPAFCAMRLHNAKPLCALRGTMVWPGSAEQFLRGTMVLALCVFYLMVFFFNTIQYVKPEIPNSTLCIAIRPYPYLALSFAA